MANDRRAILIAWYSETGHSEEAALALDKALDATIEEIRCPLYEDRHGFWLFCWRAITALFGRAAAIEPPRHDPAGFDLVVLVAPVWAGRLATPMRGYLEQFRGRLHKVAYVATLSGDDAGRAFADYAALTGQPGVGRLALSDADRNGHRDTKLLADFARTLVAGLPTPPVRDEPKD